VGVAATLSVWTPEQTAKLVVPLLDQDQDYILNDTSLAYGCSGPRPAPPSLHSKSQAPNRLLPSLPTKGQIKVQTCRQQLTVSRMRPTSRCHMPKSMGGVHALVKGAMPTLLATKPTLPWHRAKQAGYLNWGSNASSHRPDSPQLGWMGTDAKHALTRTAKCSLPLAESAQSVSSRPPL